MPPDPEKRGATQALGTAQRDRSRGGIWRPVRAVRHPRRLKPAPAPNHAPGTQDEGGGEMRGVGAGTRRHPDLHRTPQVLKDRTGGSGGRGLLEPSEPGRAAVERSSWPHPLVPPRFFFKHWLLSLAGAEPGS